MATVTTGQLATPLLPTPTDCAPYLGRVIAFDGQFVYVAAQTVPAPHGKTSPPEVIRVSIAEFAQKWWDAQISVDNPPGTLGTVDFGVAGRSSAIVLASMAVTLPAGLIDPFNGSLHVEPVVKHLLFVQICQRCGSGIELVDGGLRLLISTGDTLNGTPRWVKTVTGFDVGFANQPGGPYTPA